MAKIVTMGEIMLRLSTPNNEKFIQADEFDVCLLYTSDGRITRRNAIVMML